MLAYLVLGVCLLLAFLLASRWLVTADPKLLAQGLRYLGFGLVGAVGLLFLFTGRFFLGSALLFVAWKLYRGFHVPTLRMPGGGATKPSGRTSKVETAWLRMTLEHDSGDMAGEVLRGPFAGKRLADLDLESLVALLGECHREDPDSARLLETYLDRAVGEDWRQTAQAQGGAETVGAGGAHEDEHVGRGWGRRPPPGGRQPAMTVDEAREILGVGPEAGAAEIKDAYRRLMHKMHPDQGGSTWLAAKINQAKDILLAA